MRDDIALSDLVGYKQGYNDAIEDIAKLISGDVECEDCPKRAECGYPCWEQWKKYFIEELEKEAGNL